MKYRDYYDIIGVSKGASKEVIKRAYRKGARKYHPDVNKAADADARFKALNEAYEVLKDPEKRKLYDKYGKGWDQVKQPGNKGEDHKGQHGTDEGFNTFFHFDQDNYSHNSENVEDFLNNLFGSDFRNDSGKRAHGTGHQPERRTYESEIMLNLSEVMNAGIKSFIFKTQDYNPTSGEFETKEKSIKVRIPKGVRDGTIIRIKNFENNKGDNNGADLLLKVKIQGDRRFRINNLNLHTRVSISPWEAALGAKVKVWTIDGKVTLSIPSGTRAGKRFRLKGKGLPDRNGGNGDIIVETQIQIPDSLDDEEKKLFKELSSKSKYDPRADEGQSAGHIEKVH